MKASTPSLRVPVGDYTLTVEKAGFRTSKQEHIRLDVGAVVTLDVTLAVGSTRTSSPSPRTFR